MNIRLCVLGEPYIWGDCYEEVIVFLNIFLGDLRILEGKYPQKIPGIHTGSYHMRVEVGLFGSDFCRQSRVGSDQDVGSTFRRVESKYKVTRGQLCIRV